MRGTVLARKTPYQTHQYNEAVCNRCGIEFRHGKRDPTYCLDCRADPGFL